MTVFLQNDCVNVKIKDIRSYVLSTGIKLELELHGVTAGGTVKEVLKIVVVDVVVDKVVEIICGLCFLRGPKLITFQLKEEEEEVSKK